ncbi:MAG: F0F1 ATP synthase subunit delta [Opitutaceae bacterium]|nr:F0F1 ATP synthase subunit delta [Opitutaceae bacterium]
MALDKQIQQLAKVFLEASMEEGSISASRVTEVLRYIEENSPRHQIAVLKAYQRFVRIELEKHIAHVESATDLSDSVLENISAAMSTRYNRTIKAIASKNENLIAGIRVRVGCDVFEDSIANQLSALQSL